MLTCWGVCIMPLNHQIVDRKMYYFYNTSHSSTYFDNTQNLFLFWWMLYIEKHTQNFGYILGFGLFFWLYLSIHSIMTIIHRATKWQVSFWRPPGGWGWLVPCHYFVQWVHIGVIGVVCLHEVTVIVQIVAFSKESLLQVTDKTSMNHVLLAANAVMIHWPYMWFWRLTFG